MTVARETVTVGDTGTCLFCKRAIVLVDGLWIDPEATGDDSIWREVCDSHDTFIADHVPVLTKHREVDPDIDCGGLVAPGDIFGTEWWCVYCGRKW
jgi:hypothetical protein